MKKECAKIRFSINLTVMLCAFLPLVTNAIVLHTDDQPANKPNDSIIGRWSSNASCVAIAQNFVITTRHQGGGVGTAVQINGIYYYVKQEYKINYIPGTQDGVDLRIARIVTSSGEDANLSETAELYTSFRDTGQTTYIGGYGKYRDPNNTRTDGYTWYGSSNNTLRWGQNVANFYSDDCTVSTSYGDFTSDTLVACFNTQEQGRTYECAPAEWDSGGGWFINDGGTWKLTAITAYVLHNGYTLFDSPFRGIRITNYDSIITNHISDLVIISGYVADISGNGISGVTISSTDEYTGTTKTNSNGYYELWVPDDWSGTITASKTDLTFYQSSISYSNLTANISNQDFITVAKIDINNDGFITIDDLIIVIDQWLITGSDLEADINQDEIVDLLDFVEFANIWQ